MKGKKEEKKISTLDIIKERDIAYDFSCKVYEKFNKIIKSIILFGSQAKQKSSEGSDIDIVIIVDDCSFQWDDELVSWYREELGKLIRANPYRKPLHINTVRLSTWWADMIRGDPIVINIIRFGETLIDFGGFFNPLKVLLMQGKIRSTPESIYTLLQRAPRHIARSRFSLAGAIDGYYWAMVDSAHAALIAAKETPPSPEHIPLMLRETFVKKGLLNQEYVTWYKDIYTLSKKILHGEQTDISGKEINEWKEKSDLFVRKMAEIIGKII